MKRFYSAIRTCRGLEEFFFSNTRIIRWNWSFASVQYSNPSGAFELQTYIHNTYFVLHCHRCNVPVRLMERSIHAASALVDRTTMTPVQHGIEKCWQASCRCFGFLDEELIIYLHCPMETALHQIKQRGRVHEQTSCTIERRTIQALEKRYQERILEPHRRVIFLDTEQPFHNGFKDFCEIIMDHHLEEQRDPDDYFSRVRHCYLPMPRVAFPPKPHQLSRQPGLPMTQRVAGTWASWCSRDFCSRDDVTESSDVTVTCCYVYVF